MDPRKKNPLGVCAIYSERTAVKSGVRLMFRNPKILSSKNLLLLLRTCDCRALQPMVPFFEVRLQGAFSPQRSKWSMPWVLGKPSETRQLRNTKTRPNMAKHIIVDMHRSCSPLQTTGFGVSCYLLSKATLLGSPSASWLVSEMSTPG